MKSFRFLIVVFTFYFLLFTFTLADTLGQTVIFNIDLQYEYSGRNQVSAALRKISDKAYWYVSDDYWNGISESERNFFSSEFDEVVTEFDARIHPTEVSFWGSEWNPGIDNDPRITVLVTRLINQAGGYYDTSHENPRSQVPESNEREIIFINTLGVLNDRARVFLAHELQHLISFYQKDKLRNLSEDVWLNEARSEYSVKLIGYDADFDNSNLRRRLNAFLQSPSEPLAEWKNLSSDYGAITPFVYYLADHYGDKILTDSLKSSSVGIDSINRALRLNGFNQTFSEIFSDWTAANALNDASVAPKFGYKTESLKSLKVSPNQSFVVTGFGTNISVFNTVKDWQPTWYEFSTPIGYTGNLKIDFSGSAGSKFVVPYIAFHINGQKDIDFLDLSANGGTSFIQNFGNDIYKVVLIPANHSKISNFSESDPESYFNFNVKVVSEVPSSTPISTPLPTPSPSPTAQSTQMILDQIRSLEKQISGLQFSLSRDLSIGSRGSDVTSFQEFLRDQDFYPEARITGYFGPLTRAAVIRFQQKHGIFPQIGYVGVKTRAKLRELTQ